LSGTSASSVSTWSAGGMGGGLGKTTRQDICFRKAEDNWVASTINERPPFTGRGNKLPAKTEEKRKNHIKVWGSRAESNQSQWQARGRGSAKLKNLRTPVYGQPATGSLWGTGYGEQTARRKKSLKNKSGHDLVIPRSTTKSLFQAR